MNLSTMLQQRAAGGRSILVGLIGAGTRRSGQTFRSLLRVSALSTPSLARASPWRCSGRAIGFGLSRSEHCAASYRQQRIRSSLIDSMLMICIQTI